MKRMLLFSAIAHLALVWVLARGLPLLPRRRMDSTVYMVKVVESMPPPRIEKAEVSQPAQTDSVKAKETEVKKVKEISEQTARKKLSKREELEALREKIARRREAESRELAEERRRLQSWKQEMESRKGLEVTAQSEVPSERGTWRFPSWYGDLIRNKAFANWNPPPRVMAREACVFFEIYQDGRIGNLAVEKGSKDSSFDESALLAVKKLEPLPPLPGEFPGNSLRVHLTFRQVD